MTIDVARIEREPSVRSLGLPAAGRRVVAVALFVQDVAAIMTPVDVAAVVTPVDVARPWDDAGRSARG